MPAYVVMIRDRMAKIRRELDQVTKTRGLHRARRQCHVVAELAGRQTRVVVCLLRIGQRVGHQQSGDLALAMRAESRRGRARPCRRL